MVIVGIYRMEKFYWEERKRTKKKLTELEKKLIQLTGEIAVTGMEVEEPKEPHSSSNNK